jgi:hypothetical protein
VSATIELTQEPKAVLSGPERRKMPRYPTLQRCLVWPPNANGPNGLRCIAYNISLTGIGLTLPLPLPRGHILRIEPYEVPGAGPIQAKIVHHKPVEFLWFCGCELLRPLTDEELKAWLVVKNGWMRQEMDPRMPW